jgi:hypothetical protein
LSPSLPAHLLHRHQYPNLFFLASMPLRCPQEYHHGSAKAAARLSQPSTIRAVRGCRSVIQDARRSLTLSTSAAGFKSTKAKEVLEHRETLSFAHESLLQERHHLLPTSVARSLSSQCSTKLLGNGVFKARKQKRCWNIERYEASRMSRSYKRDIICSQLRSLLPLSSQCSTKLLRNGVLALLAGK